MAQERVQFELADIRAMRDSLEATVASLKKQYPPGTPHVLYLNTVYIKLLMFCTQHEGVENAFFELLPWEREG